MTFDVLTRLADRASARQILLMLIFSYFAQNRRFSSTASHGAGHFLLLVLRRRYV